MLLGYYEEVKLADYSFGCHDRRGKRKYICGTGDFFPPDMVLKNEYDQKVWRTCNPGSRG
jgi:hypothetical protein